MSRVLDPPVPPTASLAPPASPELPDAVETIPEIPRQDSPVASPPSASTLPPFVKRFKVSLFLENSGSVARDHLASERTFLAYVRTSLVVASTGVALVQLFTIASNTTTNDQLSFTPTVRRVQHWARPIGATMVCFGLVVLALGTTRYFRIQAALTKGMFPVARLTAASITFVLGIIIIVVFAILLSARS
ncbi:hypothetical protein DFH07DRAFT_747913 [Mycena maculata]|uniref:DUF202 domain-containing protein n=1 Tax=Mycena maculata TaxID=230809 RepID=A0AAD7IQ57_9AGAR|nr:hypothetical protein DFH07DRAFT_747913 [Mycena maculata]